MKYCTHCGAEAVDEAVICTKCGCAFNNINLKNNPSSKNDAPNGGMTALGFFFPIVGFILWLVWRDETPLKAKSAGKGALIGFCVGIGLSIIYFLVFVVILGAAAGTGSYYDSGFQALSLMLR